MKPAAAPKIYVMPEQFLAVTRGAGLPVQKAPPPPLQPPAPLKPVAEAFRPPPVSSASPPPDRGDLKVAATPTAPTGPGIPMEEGKRKMIVIWGIVGGVILIGGGLAAFFALRSVKPPAPAPPRPANVAPVNTALVNVAPVNVPPVNEPPVNLPPVNEPPPPAPDRDTDEDGLTDAEELILGTDIGLADSDGDSYPDAQELLNLYNPAGVAPQRLLDAGLVYAYEHPTQRWSIYLPRQWSIVATDQEQQELKVTMTASGEEVVIQTGLLPECTTREGGPDLGDEFTAKRGTVGFRTTTTREAPMVCFRLAADRYVGIEHRTSDPPYRFPHLYEVIIQSFAGSSAAEQ